MNQFDNDIRARDAERLQLQNHIEAFLAKGGQIQRPGAPSPSKPMDVRGYNELTWARRISDEASSRP